MSDYIEELNTRFRKTILEERSASGAKEPMGELELAMEVTRRVDAYLDFMPKQFWERQWDQLEREDSAAAQEEQLDEGGSSDSHLPPVYTPPPWSLGNARVHLHKDIPIFAQDMKNAGVAYVSAQYEGSSDDGMLGDIQFLDANERVISVPQAILDLQEVLKEMFFDTLEDRHSDWEIGGGAYGTFVWNLTTRTLHHRHHVCWTEESVSEKEESL